MKQVIAGPPADQILFLLIGFISLCKEIATVCIVQGCAPQAYLSTCSGCLVRVVCSGRRNVTHEFGFFAVSSEP